VEVGKNQNELASPKLPKSKLFEDKQVVVIQTGKFPFKQTR
jgi:hypothetical protein